MNQSKITNSHITNKVTNRKKRTN